CDQLKKKAETIAKSKQSKPRAKKEKKSAQKNQESDGTENLSDAEKIAISMGGLKDVVSAILIDAAAKD
ncbi:MAG: hypothetical protein KC468_16295, partial [Myxococcales bacterium]|nr:hypothetical protein [Myxococcales bacterium]